MVIVRCQQRNFVWEILLIGERSILAKIVSFIEMFLPFALEVDAKIAFRNIEEFPYWHNGLAVDLFLYQVWMYRVSQES